MQKAIYVFILFAAINGSMVARAQSPARSAVDSKPILSVPPEVLNVATKVLGGSATVVRYGSLSDPDSLEAIAVTPAPSPSAARNEVTISQMIVFRREGDGWVNSLSVGSKIINPNGRIAGNFGSNPRYRAAFFNRRFEDGRERFVIQLSPIDSAGNSIAPPVYISWNPMVGRYQQISLQGYGFQPETHGTLP